MADIKVFSLFLLLASCCSAQICNDVATCLANFCQDHPDWSKVNCKKTCGYCSVTNPSTPSVCSDAATCLANFCKDHPDWSEVNCKKTCGYCSGPTPPKPPVCSDAATCLANFCKDHPDWSKVNCKKTCGYCSGPNPPSPSGHCGIASAQNSRVIGGTTAKPGAWPWQVALYYRNNFHCGGSLINKNWIITAAHCVQGASKDGFVIVLGEHDRSIQEGTEQTFKATRIVEHPNYDSTKFSNDIALIKLSSPARLNTRVNTVCLPQLNTAPSVGSECFITGWGKTSHPGSFAVRLQQASLKIVGNRVCQSLNKPNTGLDITWSVICAGHGPGDQRAGCHGDSGGPLVCKNGNAWTLHGAVSWGSGQCSTASAYTVFARVSVFRSWINKYIST